MDHRRTVTPNKIKIKLFTFLIPLKGVFYLNYFIGAFMTT